MSAQWPLVGCEPVATCGELHMTGQPLRLGTGECDPTSAPRRDGREVRVARIAVRAGHAPCDLDLDRTRFNPRPVQLNRFRERFARELRPGRCRRSNTETRARTGDCRIEHRTGQVARAAENRRESPVYERRPSHQRAGHRHRAERGSIASIHRSRHIPLAISKWRNAGPFYRQPKILARSAISAFQEIIQESGARSIPAVTFRLTELVFHQPTASRIPGRAHGKRRGQAPCTGFR